MKGDRRLRVSARNGTFAGSYDQVWIAKAEWSTFVTSMVALERDRSGQASVVSISPDEFELNLTVVDRAGHLAAHGCLSKYGFGSSSGKATRSRIEYYGSVDPGTLVNLVRWLRAI